MGGDAAAGFQDVAGDGEFMGGSTDVPERVMQDEVFEMNEFTVDPERGMRVEEMRALEKALTDGSTGDALIETGKSAFAKGPLALLKKLRGSGKPGASSGAGQMKMLRRLPKILRFI